MDGDQHRICIKRRHSINPVNQMQYHSQAPISLRTGDRHTDQDADAVLLLPRILGHHRFALQSSSTCGRRSVVNCRSRPVCAYCPVMDQKQGGVRSLRAQIPRTHRAASKRKDVKLQKLKRPRMQVRHMCPANVGGAVSMQQNCNVNG